MTLAVRSLRAGGRDVPLLAGPAALSRLPHALDEIGFDGRLFVLADALALQLHGDVLNSVIPEAPVLTLSGAEEAKTLSAVSDVWDWLVGQGAQRRDALVAFGGGVVCDLVGFAAACYLRGVVLVNVPTTLLAQVYASVGVKTGVNHPRGKNLIGAFHPPAGVWIDTAFLGTWPDREYRSGLAEVVKYGVILDADLFAWLEANADAVLRREAEAVRHVVGRSCRLKADVVEKDEREETGLRAVLNYGHTFAHAFETVGGYGAWLHGEAVAAGMICASRLAERRGLIGRDVIERQLRILQRFGLPTAPLRWPVAELLAVMRNDKKAVAGRLRLVLPLRLGEVALFDDIPEAEGRRALEESIP